MVVLAPVRRFHVLSCKFMASAFDRDQQTTGAERGWPAGENRSRGLYVDDTARPELVGAEQVHYDADRAQQRHAPVQT